MNILLIGMGEVGRHLAGTLSYKGHRVVAVDSNPLSLELATEHADLMTFNGHGSAPATLQECGAQNADLVIAVTDSDEVNLLACVCAKALGARETIARVANRAYFELDGGVAHDVLGVDILLNPQILAAMEIHRIIRSFGAIEAVNLADNHVEVLDLPVADKTRYLGRQLREISMPKGALIAAINRGGRLIIPHGGDHVERGDTIWIIGDMSAIPKMEQMFGKASKARARKVMIVGGGEIGLEVARHLEADGVQVIVIEKDLDRCRHLADVLHHALIIHGDGTNRSLLVEEEVEACDAFVSLTKSDEINIMSCLLAQGLAPEVKTISLVHRGDYLPAARAVGLAVAVSPRRSAANFILGSVHAGHVHRVVQVEEGKGEILELHVPDRARVLGRDLRYIDFPKGSLVAVIVRGGKVFIPSGSDHIEPDDQVVVFTKPDVRDEVVRLFRDPSSTKVS